MSDMSRKQFAYISAQDNDFIWDRFGGRPYPSGFVILRGALRKRLPLKATLTWPRMLATYLAVLSGPGSGLPACHPASPATWKAIHLRDCFVFLALTDAIFSATFRGGARGGIQQAGHVLDVVGVELLTEMHVACHTERQQRQRVQLGKWPGISQMRA